MTTDQTTIDWIRLARTPKIGAVTFYKLSSQFGDPTRALEALPSMAAGKSLRIPSPEVVEEEIKRTKAAGGAMLILPDPIYPERLRNTETPPPVISVRGDVSLLSRPAVAIVGARNASAAGVKLAGQFAGDLGAAGQVVISGLARGIDGAAHKAALKSGTLAVLAGGVDQAYPPQHTALYNEIAEAGLLVSERPWGYKATARDFPRRNRIVAALCDGLVVVEAAEHSGSLISARLAGELGRDVMAVPGSPLDARSSGTNHLIREGAILVRDADDVLAALEGLRDRQPMLNVFEAQEPLVFDVPEVDAPHSADIPEEAAGDENIRESLMSALSIHPIPMTNLAQTVGVSAAEIAELVTELELEGRVKTFAGGEVGLQV